MQINIIPILRCLHRAYKICISPLLGNRCRYEPYCSDYALCAAETHGILYGSWLALKRVLKCHPYARGGFDPVPKNRK